MKALTLLYKIFTLIREFFVSLFFILFVLLCFTIFSLFNDNAEKRPNTAVDFHSGALLLNLDGYLADNRDEYSDFYRLLDDEEPEKISLFDVAEVLHVATKDERITGLVLDLGKLSGADFSSLDYLGNLITRFKKTGKTVIAVGNSYSQGQYYLASFADEIYLNPAGSVDVQGLRYANLYFKALLDKVEAVPHIFRVGTYKSAVEPFIRNDMSPEARQNASLWLNQLWANYTDTVSQNRAITSSALTPDPERFLALLKQANGDEARYALNQKLVSTLATPNEMKQALIQHFGDDQLGEYAHINYLDYADGLRDRFNVGQTPKIAVINVEGEITLGESTESSAGSQSVINALRNARQDNNVEAVIVRVNSPGGSAMASELIRQEISDIQAKGKPVVTSMGAMAASGGYWIAASSDKIVASPQTITGSIGIFGLALTFEKTAKNLGVAEDGIATSFLAETSALQPLNEHQAKALQMSVENGYKKFLNLVATGRKMSLSQVDKIAQGQVWTGAKAFELGLVDKLGDFDTAYTLSVELANQRRDAKGEAQTNYPIQWYTDEETSLLSGMTRKFKLQAQSALFSWFDLPVAQKFKQQTDLLSKFNDPKNLYFYCLNCGNVK